MKPPVTQHFRRSFAAMVGLLVATILLSAVFVGCGGASSLPAGTTLATSPNVTADEAFQVAQFATEDGVTLSGRLYGEGFRAVLLSHMYPADQSSWDTTAQQLADAGYLAMTYDFRGYGLSQGSKDIQYLDRDVTAAVMHLRSQGATEIVLVGASMGGTASLKAAYQLQTLSSVRVAGVATFSAPVDFMGLSAGEAVRDTVLPLLFVAAESDEGAEGARSLEDLSDARGQLEILPGSDHGTDLFSGSQAQQAQSLLLDFLQLCMPSAG